MRFAFLLPKDRQTSRPADRFVKRDLGFIVAVGAAGEDDEDDDGEEIEDDEGGDDDSGKVVQIAQDTRIVGVRGVLIEVGNPTLEPAVIAGMFENITLRPRRAGPGTQAAFRLKRTALKRLVKALTPLTQQGRVLTCRVTQGDLSAKVSGWHAQPLVTFQSNADVDSFIQRIVQMVG